LVGWFIDGDLVYCWWFGLLIVRWFFDGGLFY
jgi:hypothetical protein